jgi:hypothetical protein
VIAAIVLAIYAVCARDRFSLPRLAGFAAIVAALCVPWIAATGLLSQMSGIPPAWKLMSFPRDLFIRRVVESEFGATVFIGLVLLIIGTFLRRWRIGRRIAAVFTPDMEAFALMYCWLIVGYIGFIFLTPAASFWITRLALTLLVPTILVIAMLLCSLGSLIDARRPWLPAAIGALVFVLASNHLHHPEPTESQAAQSVRDLDAVVNYLHEAHLRPGTRLFATPNDHLVLTFYTGLPVQSIAPVRKSFLDSYPGDVIFFERESLIPTDAIEPEALQIAAGPGRHLTDEQARDISCEIASYSYRQTLAARVAGVFPPLSPIPTFARQSAVDYLEELRDRGERINRIIQDSTLIFRKTRIESGFDWWNEFFYAFVNPEWRKAHPNYRDRMRDATAAVLACTDSVVYFSPGRAAR